MQCWWYTVLFTGPSEPFSSTTDHNAAQRSLDSAIPGAYRFPFNCCDVTHALHIFFYYHCSSTLLVKNRLILAFCVNFKTFIGSFCTCYRNRSKYVELAKHRLRTMTLYGEILCEEGTERGRSPPRPILAVPNATAHPSTASVRLLCGFNVAIKGLNYYCVMTIMV